MGRRGKEGSCGGVVLVGCGGGCGSFGIRNGKIAKRREQNNKKRGGDR